MQRFGEKLRTLRQRRGLSLRDLANQLGFQSHAHAAGMYPNWENNERNTVVLFGDFGNRAFYNPGGPGPEPFEGVRYTAPGPPDLEPVVIALDNPMRVSRR